MPDMLQETDCRGCDAPLMYGEALMGHLGKRAHLRCPRCGWQWSERMQEEEQDAIEEEVAT